MKKWRFTGWKDDKTEGTEPDIDEVVEAESFSHALMLMCKKHGKVMKPSLEEIK